MQEELGQQRVGQPVLHASSAAPLQGSFPEEQVPYQRVKLQHSVAHTSALCSLVLLLFQPFHGLQHSQLFCFFLLVASFKLQPVLDDSLHN